MDYTIDLKNQPLGRAASEVAVILQGKKSPSYAPHRVGDDRALVKNVADLKFTGNKEQQKEYFKHTGYTGNLKSKPLEEVFAKNPEWVFRQAVKGMLPQNKLNKKRLRNLIFIQENGKD